MPVDQNAAIEVTAFKWVPPIARGRVKDVRVRWALEEAGRPYRTRLIGGIFQEQPSEYLADQPFGQVPVYKEGALALFESGAILLHIGERDARLLPRDPVARGRAISWMFAALNSVEPAIGGLVLVTIAAQDAEWKDAVKAAVRPFAEKRLAHVSRALGDREWLTDQFTIGDLLMIDVLRNAPEDLVSLHANLAAYIGRGTARPAFKAAMAAQLADYSDDAEARA